MKILKINFWTILLSAAITTGFQACSPKDKDSKQTAKDENDAKFDDSQEKKDAKFAVAIADASSLEVQLGKLAQSNGNSDKVKKLGEVMIKDHVQANTELKSLADKKDITLPVMLSDKSQKVYDDLATKSGKDFDKAFCKTMVKDHKDAIDAFKEEAEKGHDEDIKSWAGGKLATLEHHLMMSKECEDAIAQLK